MSATKQSVSVAFRAYRERTFASLAIRDFRYLALAALTMGFGLWFQQIGLLVYELTGSGTRLGLLIAAGGGAGLVATPIGGILSDRLSRRSVIIGASTVGAVQSAVLATLVIADLAAMWHLYLFAIIGGAVLGVNEPARFAFVRDVTTKETLPNAVALTSLAMNASRVAGPPLAGVLYGFLGTASLFFGLAALLAVGIVLTMLISRRTGQVMALSMESPLRSLWEGMRYAGQNRVILTLVVINAIPALFMYAYVQMLPFFAYNVLDAGPQGYGWLASALGYGSIVGLVLLALAGDIPRKGMVLLGAVLCYAVLVLVFTQSTVFALSIVLLMLAGVFHGPFITLVQTLLLMTSREDMTGRIVSLNGLGFGLVPLGAIPMGIAIDAWGAPSAVAAFTLAAISAIVVTVALAGSLRRA